jgi:antitoxin (DNA-binding transcriptional repressor) of toxin-antitoxin stability system
MVLPNSDLQKTKIVAILKAREEVSILEAGILIARISPISDAKKHRVPGQDRGQITILPDFDDPLSSDILDGFLNPSDPQS